MRRRALLYVIVAVLGIGLAVAVTWGTSSLVRQHIGLIGEPLDAGAGLAARSTGQGPPQERPRSRATTPAPTTPTTATPARERPATSESAPALTPSPAPETSESAADESAGRDD